MNRLPLPPTRNPVASPAIVQSQPRTVLASSVPRCPPPLVCERLLLTPCWRPPGSAATAGAPPDMALPTSSYHAPEMRMSAVNIGAFPGQKAPDIRPQARGSTRSFRPRSTQGTRGTGCTSRARRRSRRGRGRKLPPRHQVTWPNPIADEIRC